MKIPEVIYLQYYGTDADDLTPEERGSFELVKAAPEITWCSDKIFDTDIKYVLAPKDDK